MEMAEIFDKLQAVADRDDELNELISDPEVIADSQRFMKLSKEEGSLRETVEKYNEYKKLMNITDDVDKTDAQKIAEVSVHTPGSERILHGASGTDNSSYITQIANDVFNRADKLITQADEIVKPKDIVELEKEICRSSKVMIEEKGANLNVGYKQLICLVRAILRKNKILIIDEGTSNIDNA